MSDHWTEAELKATVTAYREMRSKALNGTPFVKKQYYAELANQFGRTEKAFEYRMQNISHVYDLMGLPWLPGLKPAKHIGPQHGATLERLICEQEDLPYTGRAEFEHQVIAYKAKAGPHPPAGTQEPTQHYVTARHHVRDPQVKAWVLMTAAGMCECCDKPAPFITATGEPFLEVHHLHPLADGGSDTIGNTVALCPNCHRELHHGAETPVLRERLYHKLPRLIAE